MLHLPKEENQDPEEMLQMINDGIANIKFRLHQNCKFVDDIHVCDSQTECALNGDCMSFSKILEENRTLLETVLSYPFLNKKLVEIYTKLSYSLRHSIACFGDFRSKSEREIEFLSQLEIGNESSSAGYQYDRKGAANHLLGNYQEAIICFDEAIKIMGEKANIIFRRGEAKYKAELFKEADKDFKLAIELNENASEEDRLEIEEFGTANLRLGNFDQAKTDFLKVVELNPNHADANCRLGEIYSQRVESREDLEKSVPYFEKAIKTNENHQEARLELALALFHLGKLIGGNTVLQFLSSVRQETHKEMECDQASHKAVTHYCERSLDHIKWLIEKTEENNFIFPQAKALKLNRFYQLNGKLFKLLGDNTFTSKETKDTGHIREMVIRDLESCKDVPNLKFEIGEILHGIINFKRLSEENQKLKAVAIANNFNKLFSKTKKHRVRERRIIMTAASNFFASIGSFKTAHQYVQKLQTAEQKDGVRNTVTYCESLIQDQKSLKLDLQKSKLNTDALLFYLESEKSLEKASQVLPTSSSFFLASIICLCISDFVPRLKEKYLHKALDFVKMGLEFDESNSTLASLKGDIEILLADGEPASSQKQTPNPCLPFMTNIE